MTGDQLVGGSANLPVRSNFRKLWEKATEQIVRMKSIEKMLFKNKRRNINTTPGMIPSPKNSIGKESTPTKEINNHMGTRSITRVHSDTKDSPVILSIYRQMDGYWEGMGQDLQAFVDGKVVLNGFGSNTPKNAANGMECLALQLVVHLKTPSMLGGIYLAGEYDTEDCMYDIYLDAEGKLVLEGDNYGEKRILSGKSAEPKFTTILEFVYPDQFSNNCWRKIGLIEEDDGYITGYDLNDGEHFKKFRKDKIHGGTDKVFRSSADGAYTQLIR